MCTLRGCEKMIFFSRMSGKYQESTVLYQEEKQVRRRESEYLLACEDVTLHLELILEFILYVSL